MAALQDQSKSPTLWVFGHFVNGMVSLILERKLILKVDPHGNTRCIIPEVQIITMCSSLVSPRYLCIELWKDMKRKSHLSYPLVIARSGTAKDYWSGFFNKMGPEAPDEQSGVVWEEEL